MLAEVDHTKMCMCVCMCLFSFKNRLCVTSNLCKHISKYFLKDDDVVSQNWIFYFLLSYQTHIMWRLLEGGNKESKQKTFASLDIFVSFLFLNDLVSSLFSGLKKLNVTWKKIYVLSSDIHNLLTSVILYKIMSVG